jgi:hypothetical protein
MGKKDHLRHDQSISFAIRPSLVLQLLVELCASVHHWKVQHGRIVSCTFFLEADQLFHVT